MLVIGATYPEELAEIRAVVGNLPFLVPGVVPADRLAALPYIDSCIDCAD